MGISDWIPGSEKRKLKEELEWHIRQIEENINSIPDKYSASKNHYSAEFEKLKEDILRSGLSKESLRKLLDDAEYIRRESGEYIEPKNVAGREFSTSEAAAKRRYSFLQKTPIYDRQKDLREKEQLFSRYQELRRAFEENIRVLRENGLQYAILSANNELSRMAVDETSTESVQNGIAQLEDMLVRYSLGNARAGYTDQIGLYNIQSKKLERKERREALGEQESKIAENVGWFNKSFNKVREDKAKEDFKNFERLKWQRAQKDIQENNILEFPRPRTSQEFYTQTEKPSSKWRWQKPKMPGDDYKLSRKSAYNPDIQKPFLNRSWFGDQKRKMSYAYEQTADAYGRVKESRAGQAVGAAHSYVKGGFMGFDKRKEDFDKLGELHNEAWEKTRDERAEKILSLLEEKRDLQKLLDDNPDLEKATEGVRIRRDIDAINRQLRSLGAEGIDPSANLDAIKNHLDTHAKGKFSSEHSKMREELLKKHGGEPGSFGGALSGFASWFGLAEESGIGVIVNIIAFIITWIITTTKIIGPVMDTFSFFIPFLSILQYPIYVIGIIIFYPFIKAILTPFKKDFSSLFEGDESYLSKRNKEKKKEKEKEEKKEGEEQKEE